MEEVQEVVIVGAGVSGLATALGLHRKGIRTLVLESSDSLRAAGFALLTWSNAWKALDALGVGDFLRQTHAPLQGLIVHSSTSGAVASRQLFRDRRQRMEHEARSVRRNQLLEALAKELPPNTIRFSSKVVSIEEAGRLKLLHLADGCTLKTKVLVGSDGVNSMVAKWLGFRKPSFSGRWACRGLAGSPKDYIFKHQFIENFFGNGFRAGILPCDEKTIYWFFTWTPNDQEKEAEEDAVKIRELILTKLENSKMPKNVIEAIEESDMGALVPAPLKFRQPLHLLLGNISKDNVCVTGDAFHPMTPDLGQGGCSALEDGVVLARCLSEALVGCNAEKEEEEEELRFERVKKWLKKYADERRWRSFNLIVSSYVFGYIQESDGLFLSFLRDKLSEFMSRIQLKMAEFDCGKH